MARANYGPIDAHIGFQVHLTWRAIKKKMLVSGKRSEGRISRGSYSVPILIGLNPGITPQALAKALHLDASKIAFFLRDLEADGLVARTPSATDKRKVELHLTPKGEEVSKQAAIATAAIEEPISAVITEQESAELIRILTKIQTAIS
jgi:DNA-binding MarR family transcriptional regulator